MAYSYGGWQDEFKGLSKETGFRGGAPATFDKQEDEAPVDRPQKRPVVRNPYAPIIRPTGLGAKSEVVDDTTESDDSIDDVFKNIMGNTDPLIAPSASNLTTERNTRLYLAQKSKRNKDTNSYLDNLSNEYVPFEMKSDQVPETFLLSNYYDTLAKEEASKSIFDQDQDKLGELYRKRNNARQEEKLKIALGEMPKPLPKSNMKLDVRTGRKYDDSPFAERILQKSTEGLLGTQEFIDRTAKYYGYESKVPYGLNMATRISLGDLPPLSDDLDPETGKYVGGKPTSGFVVLNRDDYVMWSEKEGIVVDRVRNAMNELTGLPLGDYIFGVAETFNKTVQSQEDFDKLQEELGPEVDLAGIMLSIKNNKDSLEGLY